MSSNTLRLIVYSAALSLLILVISKFFGDATLFALIFASGFVAICFGTFNIVKSSQISIQFKILRLGFLWFFILLGIVLFFTIEF